jgi:hypothetical protein
MVDPGEYSNISVTLKREFMEEATNSTEQTEEEKKKIDDHLKKLFSKGTEVRPKTYSHFLVCAFWFRSIWGPDDFSIFILEAIIDNFKSIKPAFHR